MKKQLSLSQQELSPFQKQVFDAVNGTQENVLAIMGRRTGKTTITRALIEAYIERRQHITLLVHAFNVDLARQYRGNKSVTLIYPRSRWNEFDIRGTNRIIADEMPRFLIERLNIPVFSVFSPYMGCEKTVKSDLWDRRYLQTSWSSELVDVEQLKELRKAVPPEHFRREFECIWDE